MDKIKSVNNKDPTKLSRFIKDDSLIESAAVYSAMVYNTKIDRDGEFVTVQNLYEMAELIVGKPVYKDHDISTIDNILARVFDARVENEELIVDFYVTDEVVKNLINSGTYLNMSLRYRIEDNKVTDVYEVSFVGIPSVRDARVKNHNIGGSDRVSIEELTKENEDLKSKIAELETIINELKQAEFDKEAEEIIDDLVEKEVECLDPADDTVKGYMIDEIRNSDIVVKAVSDGTEGAVKTKSGHTVLVSGIPEAVEAVKTKYFKLGLTGKKEEKVVNRSKGIELSYSTGNDKKKISNIPFGISF